MRLYLSVVKFVKCCIIGGKGSRRSRRTRRGFGLWVDVVLKKIQNENARLNEHNAKWHLI